MSATDLLGRFLRNHKTTTVQIGKDKVEISDWGYERVVKFNGVVYSRLNTESLYTHEYWDFLVPLGFAWQNPKLLMIGLGGGTIAYELNKLRGPAVSIEAVEINREMIGVMKDFLKEDAGMKVEVGDGAEYIRGKEDRYNIVILDAYINDLIPKQFFAREFVEDVNAALTEDGIFAMNYIKSSNGYENFETYVKLLKSFFKVYRLHTGFFTSNTVIVCSKKYGKEELVGRIRSIFKEDRQNYFMLDGYERMEELQ